MKHYFKVDYGSSVWYRFNEYFETTKKIKSLMNDFLKSHNIETSCYVLDTDRLIIYPTIKDEKFLRKQLERRSLSEYLGLSDKKYRFFKINSSLNIEWVGLCKNQNLKMDHNFIYFVSGLFPFMEYLYSYNAFVSDGDFYISLNSQDKYIYPDINLSRIDASNFYEKKKNSVSIL